MKSEEFLMKKLFSIVAFILLSHFTMNAGIIGEWTVYPAFGDITEVETAGNTTYVLASGGLFSYNSKDQSVTVYDKSKTLSDCDIAHIAWCQAARRLVIVYSNQNIDLLSENGNVINISDYYLKAMTVDKTINGIDINGKQAYLSTAFGIVKVNVADAYISDTYNIGISVNWTHVDASRIYAESKSKGQFSALLTDNLTDKANWSRTANYTAKNKSITEEQMTIAKTHRPDSPELNYFGYMRFHNNKLFTVPGYNESNEQKAYVQIKDKDSWTVVTNDIGYISPRVYMSPLKIEIDPKDDTHWFVAARTGLYEYKDNKVVKDYYCGNSPLQKAASVSEDNIDYTIVTSAIFDKENNLWVFNGSTAEPNIYELDNNHDWSIFKHSDLMNDAGKSLKRPVSTLFDSRGLLWFTNNDWRSPVLGCYNTTTDELKLYKTIINEDATQVMVGFGRCCVEDKEGNIWFGTDMGPVELLADDILSGNDEFQQIKVPRNDGTNLADYLLAGIDIACMAVDGANRKWFGTNGHGVYLVDADNITQINHFTTDNSPLLSNNVESIAIDDASGEVYFGTSKGLCSYTSDASGEASELDKDNVYAYPNPVTPDYNGPITIKGLTYKASVKIVTAGGQLVAEGMSNGGTFTWDGCDLDNKPVASGVYMVMAATEDGKKGIVTKVAIVR